MNYFADAPVCTLCGTNTHVTYTSAGWWCNEHGYTAFLEKGTKMDDQDDKLIMTLKLASGKFESTVSVPLYASEEEKQNFSNAWFDLMIAGVKCSGSARDNKAKTFTNQEKLAAALKEAYKHFNETELKDPVLLAGFLTDYLTRCT